MATNQESLDTNILLRLILNDIPAQAEKAKKLLLENPDTDFLVDDLAITETIFVLEKQRKYDREFIVGAIQDHLFVLSNLILSTELLSEILPTYLAHPSLSFNDCYLSAKTAATHTEPLWTLDRKLANQSPTAKHLP